MKRASALLIVIFAACGLAGCRGDGERAAAPSARLEQATRPAAVAAAFGKLGGAHVHGVARFAAGPERASDGVTTTTDVWVDRAGNYRVVETNDRDGGREIVRHGRELAVALRYGKMVRRRAEDPEPAHLLQEAVGAPGAAWDLLSRFVDVEDAAATTVAGRPARELRLKKAGSPRPAQPGDSEGLRSWRATVRVNEVTGRALLDDATGALLSLDVKASYALQRGGEPLAGELQVKLDVEAIGSTPAVARPEAIEPVARQRTIPEQKELLGGLATPSTTGGPLRR